MRKQLILIFLLTTSMFIPNLCSASNSLPHNPIIRFREILTRMELRKVERQKEAKRLNVVLPSEIFAARAQVAIDNAPIQAQTKSRKLLKKSVPEVRPLILKEFHACETGPEEIFQKTAKPSLRKAPKNSRGLKSRCLKAPCFYPTSKVINSSVKVVKLDTGSRPFSGTLWQMRLHRSERLKEAATRNVILPSQGGSLTNVSASYPKLAKALQQIIYFATAETGQFDLI